MASNYPGSLDSFDTIASDKKTSDSVGGRTHRQMHNDLGDAIEAVQGELGTNPSAGYDTVKARITALESGIVPVAIAEPAIWSDFTGATDTTDFPTESDSGHAWQWPAAGSGSPYRPVIVDGRYTNEAATNSGGATYIEADLGAGIARIGCDFSFGAGDSGTVIALVVWTEPITDAILDPSPYIPDAPLHIVVSQTNIGIGYYDTTTQLLRTVKHPEELAKDGTVYRIEATIDGDTITVVTPFGEVITASHAFVAANPGNWACWEIFQSDADGTSKPQIARVWAEARNPSSPVAAGTGGVALTALAAQGGHSVVAEKDNGSAWVGATGSWANIDSALTAVAPAPGPTGRLLVVYSAGVATTGSPLLLWGLSDTATMYAITGVVNCAYNGNVTAMALTTIPEGTVVTWQQLREGADTAATKLVGSSGDIATLALIPV